MKRNKVLYLIVVLLITLVIPVFAEEEIASDAVINVKDYEDKKYYLVEDFEDYEGGIPVGWERTNASQVSESQYQFEKAEGKFGTGINIGNRAIGNTPYNMLSYRFKNKIFDGKFTIEFDVKSSSTFAGTSDGRWILGLLTASEYEPTDYIDKSEKKSSIMGNYRARREKSSIIYSLPTNAMRYATFKEKAPSNSIPGITLQSADVWTHYKVEVNMMNPSYTITKDNETPIKLQLSAKRFEPRTLYNSTLDDYKYGLGIEGLVISGATVNNAKVVFDNIKVYADKSYNAYENFDDYTESTPRSRHNWYIIESPTDENKYIQVGEGTNGTTGIKIALSQKYVASRRFVVYRFTDPVKANKGFNIEFDIKTTDQNIWALNLLDEEDLVVTKDNKLTAEWNKKYDSNLIMGTIDSKPADGTRAIKIMPNGMTTANMFDAVDEKGNKVLMADNKWYNIRASLLPQGDNTSLILTITDEEGTVKISTNTIERTYDKDLYGIGIVNYGGNLSAASFAGLEAHLDNLKVFEN